MQKVHVLSLFFSYIIAAPTPQAPGVIPFRPLDCYASYDITKQFNREGDLQIGDYTVGGGGTLTASSTYSIGVTVAVGVDISISEIADLDLSATVSRTTTKAVTQGASAPCPPGPWKCALAIYPYLLEVQGDKKWLGDECGKRKDSPPSSPYDVTYPVEGDSGSVESRVEVCACKNFDHWADNGAPSIVCDVCA